MTTPLPGLRFRRAGAADAAAVAGLHAESWRRHYRGAYADAFLDGDVGADRLATWSERLATPAPGDRTVLAEDGDGGENGDAGEPVGFVHLVLDADPEHGSLVDNLHVRPARKRQGAGTRLLGLAGRLTTADAAFPRLHLWVLEQNADAQAFYLTVGATRADRHPVPAPGGVPDRLAGLPYAVRMVWPDAASLAALADRAAADRLDPA